MIASEDFSILVLDPTPEAKTEYTKAMSEVQQRSKGSNMGGL